MRPSRSYFPPLDYCYRSYLVARLRPNLATPLGSSAKTCQFSCCFATHSTISLLSSTLNTPLSRKFSRAPPRSVNFSFLQAGPAVFPFIRRRISAWRKFRNSLRALLVVNENAFICSLGSFSSAGAFLNCMVMPGISDLFLCQSLFYFSHIPAAILRTHQSQF